jgi:hypothetical protein
MPSDILTGFLFKVVVWVGPVVRRRDHDGLKTKFVNPAPSKWQLPLV